MRNPWPDPVGAARRRLRRRREADTAALARPRQADGFNGPAPVGCGRCERPLVDINGASLKSPHGRTLPREDLVCRLKARLDRKLVLICAPAGYGKTFLMQRLWSDLNGENMDCVWLDAAAGADDSAAFAEALVAAFARAGIVSEDAPRKHPEPYDALACLVRRLHARGRPTFVFADEYHVVERSGADRVLKDFLERTPPAVRILLAARSEPACGAAKLRLQGALAEFTQDDLAFSGDEILQFFQDQDVTRNEAQSLAAKTQGWPAAIGLAKLWMRDENVPAGHITRFAGDHPLMENYFRQEVLADVSAEAQSFLIATALFSSFNADLLDAALSRHDGAIMMGGLKYLQGFIAPADPARRRFRHHPLLKEHLLSRVHELGDGEYFRAVHRRAAERFEDSGEPLAALDHALRAGDDRLVQALVDSSHFGAVALAGDARVLMQIMRRLDEGRLRETARLKLARAIDRLRRGRLADARALIDRVKADLALFPPESLDASLSADLILFEALYVIHADLPETDGPAAALEDARPLFAALDPVDAGAADNAIGLLRFRCGQIEDAEAAFDRAAVRLSEAASHEDCIRNCVWRALIALLRADLAAAQRLIEKARRSYCSHFLDDAQLAAMIDIGEAALLYEKGAPDPAKTRIGDARRALIATGGLYSEFSILACQIEAMLTYRQHGPDAALGLLDACLVVARELASDRLERSLLAQRLHLAALAGGRALAGEAKSALDHRFGPATAVSQPASGWREGAERIFAEAAFHISRKRSDLALDALGALGGLSPALNLKWLTLKSAALRAIALAAEGDAVGSTQLLRGLLEEADRLQLQAFLLEEGAGAQRLLDEAARRYSKTKKADAFNHMLVKWLVASSSYLPPVERIKPPDLTAQQRRILALLAQRADRKTMAERCGTTTFNIDYHIRKMFDLFGVASANRLAAEALRLGLAGDPRIS